MKLKLENIMIEHFPHIHVIIITGPTSSGKSQLSIAIAKEISGEIINADSMQVYKDLNILSARPNEIDQRTVPHHLYGHIPVTDAYSVGIWLKEVTKEIIEVNKRGNIPIICGGTGLYLKALKEGLSNIPDVSPEYLNKAKSLYDSQGKSAALTILQIADPTQSYQLKANDRQRVIRALSVLYATGRPIQYWYKQNKNHKEHNLAFLTICLHPPRDKLYQKINSRFDWMIKNGGIDEARKIINKNLNPSLPSMKALSIPQLQQFFLGKIELDEAIAKSKQSTRNFAKRQISWIKNQSEADLTINAFPNCKNKNLSLAIVRKFLSN